MDQNFISVYSKLPRPIDYSVPGENGVRKPIDLWPGMYHSPVTMALWETRSKIFERLLCPPPADAPPQTRILTKTPAQSRTVVLYNFSSDFILREQYRDASYHIRIGKLLEDLDALAGTISVKHCSDDDSMTIPLILVTASVDKIVLTKPLSVDVDLKISGSVIWVGKSSIEIQFEVTQSTEDAVVLTANFIFVARDSKTGKAAQVNRISPETEKEKLLYDEAEARSKLKKRKRGEDRRAYEDEQISRLQSLLAEGRIFCDMPALADRNSILLRDTRLENSMICQPQQRNIHGRIFGGFLMHRAFELAFSTAYAFAGTTPCFLEVDHVDFLRPVDVGDFLRFKSCVLYTELEDSEHPLINVEVVAHVTRPEIRSSEVSNTFYFTFTVCPESKNARNASSIRKVVPATEEEARRILERMDAKALQSVKNPSNNVRFHMCQLPTWGPGIGRVFLSFCGLRSCVA
ncbi:hypothetical protein V2J09_016817 [Rumex salicifolius]